jgi:NADPH2:quinone reductase
MATRRVIELPRFGGPDVMAWDVGPRPERRDGDDVLVAVEAIGVNFADTMVRRGEYRRDQPLSFIPGFEVAGRVLEGPADGPAEGTPVVAFMENGGGYADVVVAPRTHVFPIVDGLDMVRAASLFTQGVTAWYAVHRYGLVGRGTTVLVHAAAGGLGSLLVQLCAGMGAEVIGGASTPEKLELARGHGAAHVLTPEPATLAAALRELTGGRGVDVVIDGVGGDLFAPSLRGLAHGGRYVVVGSASQQPALLDARALMPRAQTVCGFVVARVAEQDPREPARAFEAVQRAVLAGELTPQLAVLPVGEVARAHELIESRRLTGKLVLTFD